MIEKENKLMDELIENENAINSSISDEEIGRLFEEYLKKSALKENKTIATVEASFFDYLREVYNSTSMDNGKSFNDPNHFNNERIKQIEDKLKEYFESISTGLDSELTSEELVKKVLESHGFLFDSGSSDSWKDYEDLDSTPEKIEKSK